MPLFKVLSDDSSIKVTIQASCLKSLIDAFKRKSPASSALSYVVYDNSDGAVIDDDDCLLGLADFSMQSKGVVLTVRLSSTENPTANQAEVRPSSPPPSQRIPDTVPPAPRRGFSSSLFPPIRTIVMDLKTACASSPRIRNHALARARRNVTKKIVMRCSNGVLKPGDIMDYCQKLYSECPEAFIVNLKDNLPCNVFPAFVRSVYNAMNYDKSIKEGERPRANNNKRRRREVEGDVDDVEPPVKLLCTDSNGCAEGKWDPLIEDIAREGFERKKSQLQLYANVPGEGDEEMKKLVTDSYPLQRDEINRARSVGHWNLFFASWQVLRNVYFFFIHANILLGKEVKTMWFEEAGAHIKIKDFMEEYCLKEASRPSKGSRHLEINTVLTSIRELGEATASQRPVSIGVFSLIVLYFKESLSNLYLLLEKQTSDEDAITRGHQVSECPLVIVKGSSIFDETAEFSVLIRGKFHIKTRSYVESVLVAVVSYFVFNIAFPKELSKTLEFCQRFFLCINPERQARREGSKMTTMSGDVRKLAVALTNFEVSTSRWANVD